MHFTVKQMTLCALCAALISVLSPLAIPLAGQVPISLATLAVMVAASLEGPFLSAVSVIIYIFLGIIGIPVFAGYSSGAAIAFGMSGGYIFGYIALAVCTGIAAEKCAAYTDSWKRRGVLFAGMVIGTAVLYFIGTVWFMRFTGMDLAASLGACVLPFLPGDFLKMVLTVILYERLIPLLANIKR